MRGAINHVTVFMKSCTKLKSAAVPLAFNDDCVQHEDLCGKLMTDMDLDHLIGNSVDHLGHAAPRSQMRQTALCFKAEPDYGGAWP